MTWFIIKATLSYIVIIWFTIKCILIIYIYIKFLNKMNCQICLKF